MTDNELYLAMLRDEINYEQYLALTKDAIEELMEREGMSNIEAWAQHMLGKMDQMDEIENDPWWFVDAKGRTWRRDA